MTYTVTLEAASRAGLQQQIAALASEWGIEATQETAPEQAPSPDTHQKVGTHDDQPDLPLEAPAEAQDTAAEADPEPAESPEPEPDNTQQVVDKDTLREQLMRFAEEHGNAKAKELVAQWGKVSQVPEEERNAVYVAAGGEL